MRNTFVAILLIVTVAGTAIPCRADITLSLSSSAADLNNLLLGDTVNFVVDLSGLPAGVELDSLAGSVVYDGSLLGEPTITPGEIIPNPLDDPLDFLFIEDTGLADAVFLTFSIEPSDHIVGNGTFISFDVPVIGLGSGNMTIDFAGATQFNTADPLDPIVLIVQSGPPLDFVTQVPEPDSVWLILLGVLGIAFHKLRTPQQASQRVTCPVATIRNKTTSRFENHSFSTATQRDSLHHGRTSCHAKRSTVPTQRATSPRPP